jgi:aminopeptidase N
VLHMLRQRIGDDRFWAGIRDYYARYMNGTATTTDFRRVMERASGQDLSAFFEEWLSRGQIPRVEGSWRWDAATREVVVEMRQVQPGPAFSIELEVAVEGVGAAPTVQRASVGSAPTQLRLAAAERPRAVTLDPMVRTLFTGALQSRPD